MGWEVSLRERRTGRKPRSATGSRDNRSAAMSAATQPADPMPEPPLPPDEDACCGSGCDPCVWDLHERAMEKYRQALREWRARHPGDDAG